MAKNKSSISVAIAVYNEAANLDACLSSVGGLADEIVVVDGGSTDGTVEIAKKFTSKIIRTDNPPIFHINKQKALDACTGDWILQLDADEIIPEILRNEIGEAVGTKTFNGYYIPRKNYFWGHWMRKGGQYPDPVIRLVRRGKARFPSKTVHEQIEVDGKVGYLNHPMDHIAYRTRADYWRKADAYTTLTAMEMKKNGVAKNVITWCMYNIWKPKLTFLSLFFRHKGFLDGWYGLLFATFSALHFPIAYKKFVRLFVMGFFFLLITIPVRAEYVLPYPSFMPGNKLYRLTRIIDKLKNYWYFGEIAQAKYHRGLSDKYLVEAKTLFEYKQYLLGGDALRRSDEEFAKTPKNPEAAQKHIEILTGLLSIVPDSFTWTPEKAGSTELPLKDLLEASIRLRQL